MPSSCDRRVLKEVIFDGSGPRRLHLRRLSDPGQDSSPEFTIADAKESAARIITEAKEQASAIKEKAYNEGLRKGLEEGLARAAQESQEMFARAREVLQEAEAERAATINQMEKEIVELAREIASRIVAAELKVNHEVVAAIAKEALALVRDRPHLMIFVHPDDLVACQQARPQFEALLPENAVLRILPDSQVKRGGCIIDTGEGVVDATLDSRWAAIIEALKG
ncbi:MAG: FliH/SctL family protein [Bacillota bacterium]